MKQMMKSEEAARGFKRLEGLMVLGDGNCGSDGGFAESVGPVKPLVSLPENVHKQLVINMSTLIFGEEFNKVRTYNWIFSIPRSFSRDRGRFCSWS